jgi:hypothetical protein
MRRRPRWLSGNVGQEERERTSTMNRDVESILPANLKDGRRIEVELSAHARSPAPIRVRLTKGRETLGEACLPSPSAGVAGGFIVTPRRPPS